MQERASRRVRRGVTALASLAASGLVIAGSGAASAASASPHRQAGVREDGLVAVSSASFTYSGSEATTTVPAAATLADITAVGGAGGSGYAPASSAATGGDGEMVSSIVGVTQGATLYINVGATGWHCRKAGWSAVCTSKEPVSPGG